MTLGLVTACGGPEVVPPPAPLEIREDLAAGVLSDLATALADRDAEAAAALGDDASARSLLAGVVGNATALRLDVPELRLVDEDPALTASQSQGRWAAAVDASWRIDGFDSQVARSEVTVVFAQDGDRLRIHGFGGGERRLPLWLSGPLHVARAPGVLVAAAGPASVVERYARLARTAVPAVEAVTGERVPLVVEVPADGEALDRTLGADPGEYAAIAAVTTFVGRDHTEGAPVHVLVNTDVYGPLDPAGAQVVMTHEVTHLATDAVHAQAPVWLLEGYADHVALHDGTVPLAKAAGQVIRKVRADGAPRALPGAAEFDRRQQHLGVWYEAAWRAVEVLAAAGTERTLLELYRRTAEGASLDDSLEALYGFGEEELTRRWRTDLERIAG